MNLYRRGVFGSSKEPVLKDQDSYLETWRVTLVSRITPHVKSHERGPTTPVRELPMVADYLQVIG